jgi:hypothetical protein
MWRNVALFIQLSEIKLGMNTHEYSSKKLCYKIPITHLGEPHAVKVFEIKQYE